MLSSSHSQFSLLHLFTFCRLALPLTSASVFSHSLPVFSFHLHFYSFIIFPFCSHALQFLHPSSDLSVPPLSPHSLAPLSSPAAPLSLSLSLFSVSFLPTRYIISLPAVLYLSAFPSPSCSSQRPFTSLLLSWSLHLLMAEMAWTCPCRFQNYMLSHRPIHYLFHYLIILIMQIYFLFLVIRAFSLVDLSIRFHFNCAHLLHQSQS